MERKNEMSDTSAVNKSANCPHCGMIHSTTCPLIKAIEYHPNGAVKRVEFKSAPDYPKDQWIVPPFWQSPVVS